MGGSEYIYIYMYTYIYIYIIHVYMRDDAREPCKIAKALQSADSKVGRALSRVLRGAASGKSVVQAGPSGFRVG